MIHKILTFTFLMGILFTPLCAESNDKTQRPNIIFFLFDDMSWGQPQSYNPNSALRTPNLDKLTTQGMRFTDAHSAAAVCTPTRYGVITGRNPSRIGQIGVCSPRSRALIPTSRMTIASMLKDKGYRTACIGKWHLGLDWLDEETKSPPVLGEEFKGGPEELGFDYTYGYSEARSLSLIFEHDKVIKEVPEIDNQIMMADKAVEWIGKQSKEEPFFLYFPVCPPHTPVVPAMTYRGVGGGKDLVKNKPF